jgi:hypothetical protein
VELVGERSVGEEEIAEGEGENKCVFDGVAGAGA